MPKMNVESFNLDHTLVAAPFLRVADRKELPHGDVLVKYDVRFCQPNVDHLDMPVVHSLEHTMAENLRNHADYVIDFGPMGCQTGFYLILAGDHAQDEVEALVEATLRDVLEATEVPAANEVQCGWGANHTLEGAQAAARAMLASRDAWGQVYRDGVNPTETPDGTTPGAMNEAEARAAAQGTDEQGLPPQADPTPADQVDDATPEWAKNEAEQA